MLLFLFYTALTTVKMATRTVKTIKIPLTTKIISNSTIKATTKTRYLTNLPTNADCNVQNVSKF